MAESKSVTKTKELKVPLLVPVEEEELGVGKVVTANEAMREPALVLTNKHELLINVKPLVRRTGEEVIPILKNPATKTVEGFLTKFELIVPTSHRNRFTVLDFMHEFPLFKPSDDAFHIIKELEDKKVRGAPVVDDEGRLLGVLDWYDLLKALKNFSPGIPDVKVKDVMRTDEKYVIEANEKVNRAWHRLINRFLPGLVVINNKDERKVWGTITYEEFVKTNRWFFHREAEGRYVYAKVKTIMRKGVPTLKPEDNIEEAAKKMINLRYPILPVVDDEGKLIGVVLVEDVTKIYAKLPRKPKMGKIVEKAEAQRTQE